MADKSAITAKNMQAADVDAMLVSVRNSAPLKTVSIDSTGT
jgi:hypothetical protein